MEKKVYLSAGHGGADPGAVCNGLEEKDLNLSIALSCREVLWWHGVNVKMSRITDVDVSADQQIRECNSYKPDLAVDIHNNAGRGDGAEVYHHYLGGTGKTLAKNILAEIVKIGQNSRGAKTRRLASGADYYYFIRDISAPSVIVETAFVDNADDIKIIDTAAEQKNMGIAIAKGILATLNIPFRQNEPQEAPERGADGCEISLPMLSNGSEGDTVKSMQLLLIGRGCSCGTYGADGDFGTATENAVMMFQDRNGLPETGVCDVSTWKKLLGA